jgi:lysophospholipase L1-like esterase
VRWRPVVVLTILGAAAAGLLPARAVGPTQVPRIWALGDSITVGVSWPSASPGGYRAPLDQMLTNDGFAHVFVGTGTGNSSATLDARHQSHHDGHSGYRIDQARRDLDGVAGASSDAGGRWLTGVRGRAPLSPDVVLVHLGTNDILQRFDTRRFPTVDGRADLASRGQRTLFVADAVRRLSDLLLRIHALRPHALLVTATVVPIDAPVLAETVAAYAAAVRSLVGRLRARHLPVALVDLYSAFTDKAPPGARTAPGLLSTDNVHPSAAGYAVIARAFVAVLESRTLPVPAWSGGRP